ncbi:unnamed protein product [Prorocentrum cordatum]|uniref:Uncharacterized protein n=1 Tax=Prorocentrum cordatum TaxID=2364126 RepID=A0ABN9VYA4_9DINO|nr:unnamed protein product [Polarella glacialis]
MPVASSCPDVRRRQATTARNAEGGAKPLFGSKRAPGCTEGALEEQYHGRARGTTSPFRCQAAAHFSDLTEQKTLQQKQEDFTVESGRLYSRSRKTRSRNFG